MASLTWALSVRASSPPVTKVGPSVLLSVASSVCESTSLSTALTCVVTGLSGWVAAIMSGWVAGVCMSMSCTISSSESSVG